MKTYMDCLPCFLRQTIQAAKLAGADEATQKKVAQEIEKNFLPNVSTNVNPPYTSRNMHIKIRELLGNPDPYKKIKDKYNNIAMSMYPKLKAHIMDSKDVFETAVRVAIAGNVIDFGAQLEFDIDADVKDILEKKIAINDIEVLRSLLKNQKEVLYLGDNTGETIFDRMLIEVLVEDFGSKVTYVVKESPILNDATIEDAHFAGIDKIADVVSCGANSPGIVLDFCTDEFIKIFNSAKLIIAKGQGNFESLEEVSRPIFFLFKAKCDVVASHLQQPIGSIFVKKGLGYRA